jgi:hypothetical protein
MTTTERSETPRTDEFKRALSELLVDSPKSRERLWEIVCGDFERELVALRLRYTWKPVKDAPRDQQEGLIKYEGWILRSLLAEAVARERERCGKLCDAEANYRAERYDNPLLGDSPMIQGHKEVTARKLAAAIRSQPQTKGNNHD